MEHADYRRDEEGPFGYLRGRVRDDIAKSIELFCDVRSDPHGTFHKLAYAALEDLNASDEVVWRFSVQPAANLRIAAVVLMQVWRNVTARITDILQRLAFEDRDAKVRGTALCLMSDMYRDGKAEEAILGIVASVLRNRFGVHDSSLRNRLSWNWLESLVDLRDDIEYRKRRAVFDERRLQVLAGPHLDEMTKDRESAASFLADPRPELRRCAIMLLSEKWQPTTDFINACKELMLHDTDAGAKALALVTVIGHFTKSRDASVAAELAGIVSDHTQPLEIRDLAYQGLFQIADAPISTWPEVKRATVGFAFPDDVDWAFVASFSGWHR